MLFKNQDSQKLPLYAYDLTTGLPVTGDSANITVYISIDGGEFTQAGTANPTEETNASGEYYASPTQAETNGHLIRWRGESTTGDVMVVGGSAYTDLSLAALSTTVASASSTTTFVLTAGLATASVYNGMLIMVQDTGDSHWEVRRIIDYTSGRRVDVDRAFGFTPDTPDVVHIMATGYADINVVAISGDSVPADALELQYDGTGLTGDTYPATQGQVGAIAATSGGTLNYPATDDNVDGALKSITFVGTQTSGTYASTEAEDGTDHVIDDGAGGDANAIDIVYQFSIGGNRIASEVLFKGYLNGNNDSINIQAYDFVGTDWETRHVLGGQAGTINLSETITLLSKHTGRTGADIGLVFIRFVCTGQSNPTLTIDELLVGALALAGSVGYADGAIWVDTVSGTAGTESFVNGTADNPVLTWANAATLSTNLGLKRFHIVNGSAIELVASADSFTLLGDAWTLDLSGESCSAIYVHGATVSGICTGATTPQWSHCLFGTTTLPPSHLTGCGFDGTLTFGSAGEFTFDRCHSMVGGTSTPIFDFGSGLNASEVNMRSYSGGIEIRNMGAGSGSYNMSMEGNGQLIIASTCSPTSTIAIRGNFTITDNVSGGFVAGGGVISDDARFDVAQINAECDTALTDYDPPTNTEMVAAFTEIKGATWAAGTDTLEHIRDKQTDIETDTAEIGTAGAGLTAVPWNSSWDTEVQSECTDALNAYDPPTDTEMDAGLSALDLLIDSVIARTENLPDSPAAIGSAMTLDDSEDVYHADVFLTRDALNSQDEYTIVWYKNGTPVTSGITVPTIQVVKRSDGSDLIASTAMTQIGSTGCYKLDSSTRLTSGEAAVAVITATIDESSRTWRRPVGRDI